MKKITIIIILLLSPTALFPMHNTIFRLAQMISAEFCVLSGVLPGVSYYTGYSSDKWLKSRESCLAQRVVPEVSPIVKEWAKKELKEIIPMEVPVVIGPQWQTDGKSIEVPLQDMQNLEIALNLKATLCDEYATMRDNQHKAFINRKQHTLKHEAVHVLCQHYEKGICVTAIVSVIVQSACSGTSYLFNTFFNIQSPQTWKKALTRSCLAAGSIPFKLGLCFIGNNIYSRQCEKEAEDFAYKKATTRDELTDTLARFQKGDDALKKWLLQDNHEKYYDHFEIKDQWYKTRKAIFAVCSYMYKKQMDKPLLNNILVETAAFAYDPEHSSSAYYANMAQQHIDEWDKNHFKN